jgi:outer membrane protein OmpA-like peptidoglycan-associated protein
MKKIVLLPLAAVVAGCASSPPNPELPDGNTRHPVNSAESVRVFLLQRRLTDSESALAEANEEIARLKAGHVLTGAVQTGPAVVVSDSPAAAKAVVQAKASENDGQTVYRVGFAFASAKFEVPATFSGDLLSAAAQATRIDLRGRTDSAVKDEADRRIALGRALAAQRYLTAHGIEPDKIHVSYLSSGDFIADNSTADGRAQNRRVDIVLSGVPDAGERATSVSNK